MGIYYGIYLLLSIAALFATKSRGRRSVVVLALIFAALVLFIGFRFEVGGDWFVYDEFIAYAQIFDLYDALTMLEPGYALLNWISANFFHSIYFVNLVCAMLFSFGLVYFCFSRPQPILALIVAFPYIILVIGMGYTRQSAAFGLELMALMALERSGAKRFICLIAIGALFHKPVVITVVLLIFTQKNSRIVTFLILSTIGYVVVYRGFGGGYGVLYENYIATDRAASSGGLVRGIMSVIPSVALLIWGRSFDSDEARLRVWRAVAIMNIGIFPLVMIASTAGDRLMLFFIPIQMYVAARLPNLTKQVAVEMLMKIAVIGLYLVALVVWLNYADNAAAWIPYRTALFSEG